MEEPRDPDEELPSVARRDATVTPTWFKAPTEFPKHEAPTSRTTRPFSWWRTVGLLALVLLIVGMPLDFIATYASGDGAFPATMALGFVYGAIIEVLAVWGLIRLLTRR